MLKISLYLHHSIELELGSYRNRQPSMSNAHFRAKRKQNFKLHLYELLHLKKSNILIGLPCGKDLKLEILLDGNGRF